LPRGQRPYSLINGFFGRHLVEEVDDSVNCHHLGQAVTAERHRPGAHQVEHCVDQTRRDTEIRRDAYV
jgi:hypothetical protein